MLDSYTVSRMGEKESDKWRIGRYNVYGSIKKIDTNQGIVFLEHITIDDYTEEGLMHMENYIYYNNTMKKLNLCKGDLIAFRATVMRYNIFYDDWYAPIKRRLINVRNIKRIKYGKDIK